MTVSTVCVTKLSMSFPPPPPPRPGESQDQGSGEDAVSRLRGLIAEGGMMAVVQREQSTTMGSFGNSIIVSHRIHRGSQTGTEAPGGDRGTQGRGLGWW